MQEKTGQAMGATKDTAQHAKESTKQKPSQQVWLVHQSRPFHARTRTNEHRHALKLNPTAGFSWLLLCFDSQATEQVKSAAAGAKDAVMNTLGMGGDNSKQGDTNTNNSKDSTITRDH